MKFIIDKKIFEEFPDASEYIIVARGINNEVSSKWINDQTHKVAEKLRSLGVSVLDQDKYKAWTDIYAQALLNVGVKNSDILPSHVSLTKRLLSGKDMPNINPIVNFYNLYSVKYGIPAGCEDLSRIYGDVKLHFARDGEKFIEIGDTKISNVMENEVVWSDDHSVTCRMWGWKQSERTKIRKDSLDVYFAFDCLDSLDVNYSEIVQIFCNQLKSEFGAQVDVGILNQKKPEFEIDYKSKNIEGVDVNKDLLSFVTKKEKSSNVQNFKKRRSESLGFLNPNFFLKNLNDSLDEKFKDLVKGNSFDLQVSQHKDNGDVSSTVAFKLASVYKKSPTDIGEMLLSSIKADSDFSLFFDDISVASNGFLNFSISKSLLMSELEVALNAGPKFGSFNEGKGKKVIVESPSINPNAPAHVGHLLNLFIGRALSRLLRKSGLEVDSDNLVNDKDNKVCMALWAYLKYGEGKTPESESIKPDHFVGQYYAMGRKAYKEDKKAKKAIDDMLIKLESGDPELNKKWETLVNWAFDGHLQTFKRLKEEQGHIWRESDLWQKGKDVILDNLKPGVVEKLPDGAIVGRLEQDYGVPDVILLRSDGTSLYHTQDVYLTLKKIEKFNPWKAIWVVGNEQITHFQRLFALLDKLQILPIENLYHLPHGMVVDSNGNKISSRSGKDLSADELLDIATSKAEEVMSHRKVSVELEDEDQIAEKVGIGAVRFAFLSRDPLKDITFDIDSAVSFSGKSGPYVMYSYTRAKSVLDAEYEPGFDIYGLGFRCEVKSNNSDIMTTLDKDVVIKLLSYPKILEIAANSYAPNVVAEYIFELASSFNNFYENESIKGSCGDVKALRLAVTLLTARVLRDGLAILGIETPDKM